MRFFIYISLDNTVLDFITSLEVSCVAGEDGCYLEASCVPSQPGLVRLAVLDLNITLAAN